MTEQNIVPSLSDEKVVKNVTIASKTDQGGISISSHVEIEEQKHVKD